jgi:hypothetical protein
MPSPQNRIQQRADLLADAISSRISHTYRSLTEPVPAFQTRLPVDDQIRQYRERLASGGLIAMRESAGGPLPDSDVDRYVQHMERLVASNAQKAYGLPPLEEEL